MRADSSFGGERLGEVVVGAGLEPGDDVVGVVAGGDHHDRHVAVRRSVRHSSNPSMPGSMMSISTTSGVGRVEQLDRLLAALGLVDRPALVLERQLHGGADALVVFDGQDAGSHIPHDAAYGARCRDHSPRSGVAERGDQCRVDAGRGSHQLVGACRTAGEVAGDGTRLACDQLAGGEVPRVEASS